MLTPNTPIPKIPSPSTPESPVTPLSTVQSTVNGLLVLVLSGPAVDVLAREPSAMDVLDVECHEGGRSVRATLGMGAAGVHTIELQEQVAPASMVAKFSKKRRTLTLTSTVV